MVPAAEEDIAMPNDDFVEIERDQRGTKTSPVVVRMINLRGGSRRASLSLSSEVVALMRMETWRCSAAYSVSQACFRVRHAVNGPYEMTKPPTGRGGRAGEPKEQKRYLLRVPLPPQLEKVADDEPRAARYEVVDETLYVYAPEEWYSEKKATASLPLRPQDRVVRGESADERITRHVLPTGDPPPGRSALDQRKYSR